MASAHYLVGDSVSESGEIRWKDGTRYDDPRTFAIKQWHALGRVPIVRDTRVTATDLVFRDFRGCGTAIVGYWQPRDGADSINFNACLMRKQSKSVRRDGHPRAGARAQACPPFRQQAERALA